MTVIDHPASEAPLPDRAQALDAAVCYDLLATDDVGRIVFTDGGLPAIRPVNYVMLGHRIVFRTVPGSRLAGAVTGQVVAFEVDQLDRASRLGWSVVATGVVHPLSESDIARATGLQLAPWAGGERDLFLAVTPGLVTGRVIGP